jgi:signal transduction histidine kinase/CheY-like chemotaxis protein
MVAPLSPVLALGIFLAEAGWFEPVAATIGAIALAVLAWRLSKTQAKTTADLTERTRQLAHEREKNIQTSLEKEHLTRENKAKSEMLATLSREIRGHLNGIMGSADLLVDHSLKPRQRENLATLRASAESLHQSLNDVIDYSSIETGQIKIAHAPFELRQPLTDVIETLSPLALLKALELVLIVSPDVPLHVTGDAGRLRQVLLNLTANAVKFTAQGRVVLRVSLAPGSSATSKLGARWLHFSVTDTGPTIPEDAHATIFDRPSDSISKSPRNFGSAGLELAIVKRLVELMGGKIGARGLPEGGSEFWAVLALPAQEDQPGSAIVRLADLHVVVLDDLGAARVALSAMLTRLGIDHDTTDTGAQAVEMLHDALDAEARDLVLILDESVAKASGTELAALLAPDANLRSTRIVLLSRDPEGVATTVYGFPVAAVLRKPLLRGEVLLDALRPTPKGSRVPFAAVPPLVSRTRPLILVVDDDNISRSVSSQLLEILGCDVELAESGAAAISLAHQTGFDLIFMDCQMPEMDGFEATQKILTSVNRVAPPIVALTANTSARDRERCLAAGMSDFVAKPVHKAELTRVLKRWTRHEAVPVRTK